MKFIHFPIIDTMIEFYQKPLGTKRFEHYMKTLNGKSNNDLEVPIPHFNPMGKDHILNTLLDLKKLNIDDIIHDILIDINLKIPSNNPTPIKVVLSLADDLEGGWTNKYSTDYDSKFKLNAYVTRNFCLPVIWTSEAINKEILENCIESYCLRTLYWKNNSKPITLEDHIKQELFVHRNCKTTSNYSNLVDSNHLQIFYTKNSQTSDYSKIFNFFYGDSICTELGYAKYGINETLAGFKYVKLLDN